MLMKQNQAQLMLVNQNKAYPTHMKQIKHTPSYETKSSTNHADETY